MPNELLPCPFCGSPAEATMPLKPTLDEALTSNDRDAKCSLPKCVGRYVHCRVDEWNRRAHSPAVRELVESARAMVSVAQEYYDMECGENGAPAIERVNDAIAAVEREAT